MSLSEGVALGHNFSSPVRRSQQKAEKATAPLPLQFVIPVSRTQALRLLNRARVFYLRGGGMVSSVVTSGCPKRSEGGSPVGTRRNTIPPQTKKTKRLNTKALIPKNQGFICARYWDRTSDLFRVREARYRCANRAHKTVVLLRGEDGIRTRVHGFAGRCLTTRPPHRIRSTRERVRTLGVLTSG